VVLPTARLQFDDITDLKGQLWKKLVAVMTTQFKWTAVMTHHFSKQPLITRAQFNFRNQPVQ
jgi:hypothetical protein